MKRSSVCLTLLLVLSMLSGCTGIGDKTASMSMIYGATAVLSLLLLIGYCCMAHKKEVWFLLLFVSVLVVDIGYFTLAISSTLEEALLSNRISYLGSVLLPMSMLMIILDVTGLQYRKWLPGVLLGIGIVVFLIAASPGYLDIYYKEVSLEVIDGVSILRKDYGPWHCCYLFYLLIYFAAMVARIVYATVKKKIDTTAHAVILAIAVFGNLGVWLIEQLVKIEFEILSVSYVISEMFLLGLHLIMAENQRLKEIVEQKEIQAVTAPPSGPAETPVPTNGSVIFSDGQVELFVSGLGELTPTERTIYEAYIDHKTTKEIMAMLDIKENTLKFHNKNLYGKLGVSSRKQLMAIRRQIEATTGKTPV